MKLANLKYLAILFLFLANSCGNDIQPLQPMLEEQNLQEASPEMTEANGWFDRKIQPLVLRAMVDYDHDRSGGIDYRETNTNWKTIIGKNENFRREKYLSNEKAEVRTYTMSRLFIGADKDRNGISTEEEITKFISDTYDTNKDGILQSRGLKFWQEKNEYQLYFREVAEEFKSRSEIKFGSDPKPSNAPNTNIGNVPSANTPVVTQPYQR